jgi:hypothetical protein
MGVENNDRKSQITSPKPLAVDDVPDKAENIGAAGEIGIAWAPAPALGEGLKIAPLAPGPSTKSQWPNAKQKKTEENRADDRDEHIEFKGTRRTFSTTGSDRV